MSAKDFGCFFCLGKSNNSSDKCPICNEQLDISVFLKSLQIADYRIIDILGRGFNGWTVLAEDYYQNFAIKIIPKHRSKEGIVREPRALAECSPHPNIARFVRFIENDNFRINNKTVPVTCLVFEYIPQSRPLSQIIEDPTVKLCKGDVVAILRGIAKGLERMHSKNLWHDDLHDDNILLREVQADEDLRGRFEAKLIDFGSVEPRDSTTQEKCQRNDYWYVSKHIYGLVHRFEYGNQAELTPTDRTFTNKLRRLAHRLADSDVSRRSLTPLEISKEVSAAYDECSIGHNYSSFEEMKKHLGVALTQPLENTNALYLAPQDISLLFRDDLGWEQRLHRSEPVMVVGPRGCGKTMLLRYLSIGSFARPKNTDETPESVGSRLDAMHYIGFLINIGQLRTPFLRSAYKELEKNHQDVAEEFCREYLNLSFGYEIVRSLLWLDVEKILLLTSDDKELLVALFGNMLAEEDSSKRFESLHSIAEALDRRVMLLSNFRTHSEYIATQFARDDVLHKMGQTLRRLSWAKNKEIWFLLDDYSVTVIPELAQKAYNPVLFFPSNELRIKLSSEGEGPNVTDTLKRKYREGREVSKVNLGEVYFQSAEDAGRKFFESILDARFKETGKGSIEELKTLLGEHESKGSFGSYINGLSKPGLARFYGFDVICKLCSGDVSFVIELLHSVTQGKWDSNLKSISPFDQDVVIKRFAQRQLSELRNVADYGMRLHNFANCMGELIKSYLVESKDKLHADERLRIEIEGPGELGSEAQRMHEALLRYSVLISGGAGKNKAGLPTKKLFFRRMFAPCYPFSPSRSGCIAISHQEYEKWLLDPSAMKPAPSKSPTAGLFNKDQP